jgi:transposase
MSKRATIYQRNSARIKAKVNDGASTRDLADDLGCSTSTALKCKRRAENDLDTTGDNSSTA